MLSKDPKKRPTILFILENFKLELTHHFEPKSPQIIQNWMSFENIGIEEWENLDNGMISKKR